VTCDDAFGRGPKAAERFYVITDNAFVFGIQSIGLHSLVFQILQVFVRSYGPLKEVRRSAPALGQQHHDVMRRRRRRRRRRGGSSSNSGSKLLQWRHCHRLLDVSARMLVGWWCSRQSEFSKQNNPH
jgi:hypothetical protein